MTETALAMVTKILIACLYVYVKKVEHMTIPEFITKEVVK